MHSFSSSPLNALTTRESRGEVPIERVEILRRSWWKALFGRGTQGKKRLSAFGARRVGLGSMNRSAKLQGDQLHSVSPHRAVTERMFSQFASQEAKRALAKARRGVVGSAGIIITWLRHTVLPRGRRERVRQILISCGCERSKREKRALFQLRRPTIAGGADLYTTCELYQSCARPSRPL